MQKLKQHIASRQKRVDLHLPILGASANGSAARLVLHPRVIVRAIFDPRHGIDMTQAIVSRIAQELRDRFGGNDVLNWLEAERLLHGFIEEVSHNANFEVGAERTRGELPAQPSFAARRSRNSLRNERRRVTAARTVPAVDDHAQRPSRRKGLAFQ